MNTLVLSKDIPTSIIARLTTLALMQLEGLQQIPKIIGLHKQLH